MLNFPGQLSLLATGLQLLLPSAVGPSPPRLEVALDLKHHLFGSDE
jgi:hypothetical protein